VIRIGTAHWALPVAVQDRFPGDGPHLARYARVFNATEINSSFHRRHRPTTYARWAASVPEHFRFAVKTPKTITHERRLLDAQSLLEVFLDEVAGLGDRLGCLLVQLPPSLAFAEEDVKPFFAALRARHAGDVAVEPRHASWFGVSASTLLMHYRLARVAADPARVAAAGAPGGSNELAYWRLHGSPDVYRSSYSDGALDGLARKIRDADEQGQRVWCIFDNTTLGAATVNALILQQRSRCDGR
jgi:uncharacterized protein YecE (DUF72 family)